MSRFTCKDFRREHRFFCNEFAPILAEAEPENEREFGNPIENREFSKCCFKTNDENDVLSGRRHHHLRS
ncbi:hypothetical protein DRW41_21855 [Neobacillus piezotolerans]|uniref:Uncharacterized protein n=1 Tax=Neobacillus piezotolerans TaxID=2259171 RepID=A0A3D8GJW6_9BACI|nr:hypothetical protein [Neobacillus piezotolerans]RDU34743.1 hypothetical protein DRW41_21855 [Neobacillus piezotolerans]